MPIYPRVFVRAIREETRHKRDGSTFTVWIVDTDQPEPFETGDKWLGSLCHGASLKQIPLVVRTMQTAWLERIISVSRLEPVCSPETEARA